MTKGGLPTGVRYLAGNFRWEISWQGKRVYGTADTVEDAVAAREQAKQAMRTGDISQMPKRKPRVLTEQQKAFKPAIPVCKYTPMPMPAEEMTVMPDDDDDEQCPTLLQAIHYAMQTKWRGAKSMRTIRINASCALDFFGVDMPVNKITAKRIAAYVQHLLQLKNSPATINRKLAVLSTVLQIMKRHGHIKEVPVIDRFPERKGRVHFILPKEEERILKILEHWGQDRVHDIVIVLLDTGIRVSELLKLNPMTDIAFDIGTHGTVYLNDTKNTTSRGVPLTERANQAMRRLLESSTDPTLIVPEGYEWLRRMWDRVRAYMKQTDNPNFILHILRHTCCSRLVQRGAPLKKVQEWMGHKSIQTTMRYAHLCPDSLYDMTALLEPKKEEQPAV